MITKARGLDVVAWLIVAPLLVVTSPIWLPLLVMLCLGKLVHWAFERAFA